MPMTIRRGWQALGAAALLASLGGCNWGPRPKNLVPAISPAGANVTLHVTGEASDRRGELFAVDSLGVTIHDGTLLRVRWSRLSALDVDRLGSDFDVRPGERVPPSKRSQLALVSRFPPGLSGPLLAQVLAALHQQTLDEIQ